MKPLKALLLTFIACVVFVAFSLYYHYKKGNIILQDSKVIFKKDSKKINLKDSILKKYANRAPKIWQENPLGSINRIENTTNTIFLTFDACGGEYDSNLINLLIKNNVKATLFISARWIKAHESDFIALSKNPLFAIQNHGTNHKPLSVEGKSIYGIKGTNSLSEVFDEINDNGELMLKLTGKKPTYFRSGGAYYDDVAIDIARDMGYKIGGFSIIGDGGASFSHAKILSQGRKAKEGDILIYHFNKPQSATAKALEILIAEWKSKGFNFGILE